ncbi:MAG: hypothetical protein ACNI25_02940 [Halarcobacter sp.]
MLLAIGETTSKIVFSTLLTKAINNLLTSKNKDKLEKKNYLLSYKTKLLIKLYEKISLLDDNFLSSDLDVIKSIINKISIIIEDKDFNEKLDNYLFILEESDKNKYGIDMQLINNEMKQVIKKNIK